MKLLAVCVYPGVNHQCLLHRLSKGQKRLRQDRLYRQRIADTDEALKLDRLTARYFNSLGIHPFVVFGE
jgi:hypothetical protein